MNLTDLNTLSSLYRQNFEKTGHCEKHGDLEREPPIRADHGSEITRKMSPSCSKTRPENHCHLLVALSGIVALGFFSPFHKLQKIRRAVGLALISS